MNPILALSDTQKETVMREFRNPADSRRPVERAKIGEHKIGRVATSHDFEIILATKKNPDSKPLTRDTPAIICMRRDLEATKRLRSTRASRAWRAGYGGGSLTMTGGSSRRQMPSKAFQSG